MLPCEAALSKSVGYIGIEIWIKHRGFNYPPWGNALEKELRSDSYPTPHAGGDSPISSLSAATVLPFFSLTSCAVWQGWRREGAALCQAD